MIGEFVNACLAPFSLQLSRVNADTYWMRQQYLESREFKYVLWIDRIYDQIREVPGHIVELGVAYGRNAILFSHLARMYGEDDVRKYYGFDTFSGYNAQSLQNNAKLSADAWNDNSKAKVEGRLKRAGVDQNCSLVAGDILHTLPDFLSRSPDLRVAILYVDCNAYEPAIFGMETLLPFMSPRGIVCIDEKQQGGETRALIEFCQKHDFEFRRDRSPFAIPAYTRVLR